jgi:hypothetical protein
MTRATKDRFHHGGISSCVVNVDNIGHKSLL